FVSRTMHHLSAKPQILLVDDDPDAVEQLNGILTAAGYGCHCSRDCVQAVELVRDVTPDLIVADIHLAGQNGVTLCERLRRDAGLSDVPIMFLSAAQIPDIIRRPHATGGTYYLRKPVDPEVLLELVDKALWMPQLAGTH